MKRKAATLVATGVRYPSKGDEQAFFEWLQRIRCVGKVKGIGRDLLIALKRPPADEELREVIALFRRYQVDMRQLAALETSENSAWFRKAGAYWHRRVFG